MVTTCWRERFRDSDQMPGSFLESTGGLILASAEANGTYCWLFGSDDCMRPGSIRRVLHEIRDGHDIYLMNRRECSPSLVPLRDRLYLDRTVGNRLFDFTTHPLSEYLDRCRSLGAIFSYLSSIVVRKKAWDAFPCAPAFLGTAYSHVYVLLSMIAHGCRLKYIVDPLVLCRAGYDSFAGADPCSRANLDLRGYSMLSDVVFPHDPDSRAGIRRILYDHCCSQYFRPPHRFVKLRSLAGQQTWDELKRHYVELWGRTLELRLVNAVRLPAAFVQILLTLKRRFTAPAL